MIIRTNLEKKEIYIQDNNDINLESAFNKKVQGVKKVIEYIEENRERLLTLSLSSILKELREVKDLNFHSYCVMD